MAQEMSEAMALKIKAAYENLAQIAKNWNKDEKVEFFAKNVSDLGDALAKGNRETIHTMSLTVAASALMIADLTDI